ncbi:hypothetical protein Q0590_36165 [Rhodocytophaga aerolata]|uniref:Uncharacterized protein n=1 Tax=Rhodocytophaga aerolata TaxID=455078 RepID=A0ABT8RJ36_9BACT|nr:hypothetical protein [Rhodocytophaga aerolata]MDO1451766.1 hypothetical protein [Rhodocytophaga aerolata]
MTRILIGILLIVFGSFIGIFAVYFLVMIVKFYVQYADSEMGNEAGGFMQLFWIGFIIAGITSFFANRKGIKLLKIEKIDDK